MFAKYTVERCSTDLAAVREQNNSKSLHEIELSAESATEITATALAFPEQGTCEVKNALVLLESQLMLFWSPARLSNVRNARTDNSVLDSIIIIYIDHCAIWLTLFGRPCLFLFPPLFWNLIDVYFLSFSYYS